MPLNGSLEASSIYISLNARSQPETYVGPPLTQLLRLFLSNSVADSPQHWGLLLTDLHTNPVLHHASNRIGPWTYEQKTADPEQSVTLIVLLLVDKVKNHSRAREVIKGIPADGNPSQRTGESFSCRIWAKDVLVSLHECGEIVLPKNIGRIKMIIFFMHSKY